MEGVRHDEEDQRKTLIVRNETVLSEKLDFQEKRQSSQTFQTDLRPNYDFRFSVSMVLDKTLDFRKTLTLRNKPVLNKQIFVAVIYNEFLLLGYGVL